MRRVFAVLMALVLIAITYLTTAVPTVQAIVEAGWPAGTPGLPRHPGWIERSRGDPRQRRVRVRHGSDVRDERRASLRGTVRGVH